MAQLEEYHRPADIPTALSLLDRPSPRTVPLAGGTWLVPRIGKEVQARAVVDLSELGLDQIERDPDTLRLGPVATLAAVIEDEDCRTLADGILVQTARRDATLNVRNAATIGGTVVVAPVDSEFVLALLALNAELSVRSDGISTWSLDQFLVEPAVALDGGLLTQVRIHLPLQLSGGVARVTRTPSDHPIVAAVAVIVGDNDATRIALGGVARRPLLVTLDQRTDAETTIADKIDSAEPYEDFRGSADYRREMGALLAQRALQRAIVHQREY